MPVASCVQKAMRSQPGGCSPACCAIMQLLGMGPAPCLTHELPAQLQAHPIAPIDILSLHMGKG